MSLEISTPEQTKISPEQQAVTNLSAIVTDALDRQGAVGYPLEDGSRIRKVEVTPPIGPSLAEITASDGTVHYEKKDIFFQSHDRGSMTWRWQKGGSSVDYTGKMEVAGHTNKTIRDEAGIKGVQSDVEYTISRLPEKPIQQKGLIKRLIGRWALRR